MFPFVSTNDFGGFRTHYFRNVSLGFYHCAEVANPVANLMKFLCQNFEKDVKVIVPGRSVLLNLMLALKA